MWECLGLKKKKNESRNDLIKYLKRHHIKELQELSVVQDCRVQNNGFIRQEDRFQLKVSILRVTAMVTKSTLYMWIPRRMATLLMEDSEKQNYVFL